MFSLAILIVRGLELHRFSSFARLFEAFGVYSVFQWIVILVVDTIEYNKNAPLAQLVEQLTLNQWVPGSNP